MTFKLKLNLTRGLLDRVARARANRALDRTHGVSPRRRQIGVPARLWSHGAVVALCLSVAYLGRRDAPPPALGYSAGPVTFVVDNGPMKGNVLHTSGALVAWPAPVSASTGAPTVHPGDSSRFPFLNALREMPLSMSNIITGNVQPSNGSSPVLSPIVYVVAPGDSLWSIAQNFAVSTDSLASANQIDVTSPLTIGQKLAIPTSVGFLYVVQNGDTLGGISDRYQSAPDNITHANRLADPDNLRVGQTLMIPGGKLPAPASPPPTPSAVVGGSYVVQDGDSVSSIAGALGTDVDALIATNQLAAPYVLQPGQKLTIPSTQPTPRPAVATATPPGPAIKAHPPSRYVVRAGDTLAHIASVFGLDLQTIVADNGITDPSLLQPGQQLVLAVAPRKPRAEPAKPVAEPITPTVVPTATPRPIPSPTPSPTPSPNPSPTPSPIPTPRATPAPSPAPVRSHNPGAGWNVVSVASKYLGYPYVWGGTSPSGFDCSGFVWYVYGQAGVPIPRELYNQASTGKAVARGDLQAGDIVFFANTYKSGLSHDGIYIGGGRFISAADYNTGVIVSSLSDAYWSAHYSGATRPW